MQRWFVVRGAAAGLVGAAVASAAVAGTPALTVLWNFSNPTHILPGADPSLLVADANTGAHPYGALIAAPNGGFYGTTMVGGAPSLACPSGCGTVFELVPPSGNQTQWTESVLWTFSGADGNNPYAGVVADKSGALYGTTEYGGKANAGAVFKLTPPAPGQSQWSESTLWNFSGGADGGRPFDVLHRDSSGALYGTTYQGGLFNLGTVFKLTRQKSGRRNWTESVVWSFTGGANDGMYPIGGVVGDANGSLYGTTAASINGFGIAFELTPPAAGTTQWTESPIYSWTDETWGAHPLSTLTFGKDGALYGSTARGGYWLGGVVFKLASGTSGRLWTLTKLWDLPQDAYPHGSLIADQSGAVYGTADQGGPTRFGLIFKLTPPPAGQTQWTASTLWNFTGGAGGYYPNAGLALDSTGALYSTTINGGAGGGTVFKLTQ